MIKIYNLNAGYEDLQVLKDVSLELEPGSISVLMGPNGAGKSTLLKSIFNLVEINSGKIEFLNQNITRLPTHELLEVGIAYVPQGRINFGVLTVNDNLLLGAYHIEDRDLVHKNLEQIYGEFPILKEKQNQHAFSLSGGQQQTLALARALMNLPKLLLLDEPSLGLAPKLVKAVFQKIKEINQKFETTILIVEHNLKSVLDIADFGFVMVGGEIIAHDTCQRLKHSEVLKKVFVGTYE